MEQVSTSRGASGSREIASNSRLKAGFASNWQLGPEFDVKPVENPNGVPSAPQISSDAAAVSESFSVRSLDEFLPQNPSSSCFAYLFYCENLIRDIKYNREGQTSLFSIATVFVRLVTQTFSLPFLRVTLTYHSTKRIFVPYS